MSSNMFTHISKFISLGAKSGGLAALLLAATLDGTSVLAQQQAQVVQASTQMTPLPAIQPVGYVSTDPDSRCKSSNRRSLSSKFRCKPSRLRCSSSCSNCKHRAAVPMVAPQAPAVAPPPGYVVGSDRVFAGAWGPGGPVFSTKNGDFKFHPRGLIQLDVIAPGPPGQFGPTPGGNGSINNLQTQDSATFRRFRLGADGTMYENIDWVMECDLAFALQNVDPGASAVPLSGLRSVGTLTKANTSGQGGNTMNAIQPTTCFMTFKEVPLFSNIRVGNQQDWISFEHIESRRFLDFMERSAIMDAFFGPTITVISPVFRLSGRRKTNGPTFIWVPIITASTIPAPPTILVAVLGWATSVAPGARTTTKPRTGDTWSTPVSVRSIARSIRISHRPTVATMSASATAVTCVKRRRRWT